MHATTNASTPSMDRGEQSYVTGIPLLQALARIIFLDQDPISGRNIDHATTARDLLRVCILGIILMGSSAQGSIEKFGLTSHSNLVHKLIGCGKTANNLLRSEELPRDVVDVSTLGTHLPRLTSGGLSLVLNYVAFWTSDGYLGWGPPGMEAGDAICVVIGCDVPVALGRVGDHFIHIGPCWVLGLMNGEALEKVSSGPAEFASFDMV